MSSYPGDENFSYDKQRKEMGFGSFIDAVGKNLELLDKQRQMNEQHDIILDGPKMSKPPTKIYLIGALRNKQIPTLAQVLRSEGFEVFDDWYAAGPDADDYWRDYEKGRGHNYVDALNGFAADHVFEFDKRHLSATDIALLVLPAGKSGHLELGWALGRGKKGYILYPEEPERYDVMYKFADGVFSDVNLLIEEMKK